MTTTRKRKAAGPPRFVVRILWRFHRGIVRMSGGRIGLWVPRPGERFGVMGLTTLGRRSGRTRTVILGYFEDGENLVTLAMNGWTDAEPAWWLNLQARPDAKALLRTGTRTVRARAAEGDERQRLWAMVGEYPGWGDDLDGLAAQRPVNTAVVVFQPHTAT